MIDKTIEINAMATAFQEAAMQPVTWVDAKRGCRAALAALAETMPEFLEPMGMNEMSVINCLLENSDNYKKLKNLGK